MDLIVRLFYFYVNLCRFDDRACRSFVSFPPVCQLPPYPISFLWPTDALTRSSEFQVHGIVDEGCPVSHETCPEYCSLFHPTCSYDDRMRSFFGSGMRVGLLQEILLEGPRSMPSILGRFLNSKPHCSILRMFGLDSIGMAISEQPNVVIAGLASLPDTISRNPLIVAIHEPLDTNGTYRICVNSVSPASVVLCTGDERQELTPSYFLCVNKTLDIPSYYWFETTVLNTTYRTPRHEIIS